MIRERSEVVRGGAPPLVDGLVGIAHGGHRRAVGEKCLEEPPLGGVGVLVLVEEDRSVLLPDPLDDEGMGLDQLHGPGDEVAVVEHAQPPLRRVIGDQRPGQLAPLLDRLVPFVEIQQVGGRLQVVGQIVREADQLAADRGPVGDVVQGEPGTADLVEQELAGECRSDDLHVTLDADQRPVGGEQLGGESVISEHIDLASRIGQCAAGRADPLLELVGGLVGERDPQHLLGLHAVLVEERKDPHGQRGRLAGAGAGLDSQRSEAERRDRLLFGAGGEVAHRTNASRPSGQAGQTSFTEQVRQWSPA